VKNSVRQYGQLEEIRKDHVNRYNFAANLIPKQSRVLDAACGCGYGSRIIHDSGSKVVGVDIDVSAIEYAEANYAGPGYIVGSVLEPPWVGTFDAIVSFETIEHISDPMRALKHFRDSVDGLFICSVPNEKVHPFVAENYELDDYPHLRHYTSREFDAILESADFKILDRLCQKGKKSDVEQGVDGMFLVYVCK